MGYLPSGGRRCVPESLPAKLTTVVRFSTKGGLRELLLDRAKTHHGATPIKAHLGGGDCKKVSPSSTTQGRLYSGARRRMTDQCNQKKKKKGMKDIVFHAFFFSSLLYLFI